ncbi:MAG: hypothetical protein M0C28_03425 [Candidatus Moduliflexus flocculans]|nr:hypothetical protein [Candidatus Moduliflexus flocculans]
MARIVAPRIAAGSGGWARSLPADFGTRRLAGVLSMLVAEAPLLAVLSALAWAVTDPGPMPGATDIVRLTEHVGRVAPHLAGLVLGATAAGLARLPPLPSLPMRALPLAACYLSFGRDPAVVGLSGLVLALATALSGRSTTVRKHHGPRRRLLSFAFFPALALRAVRGRILLAYLPALAVLGAAWLFLRNNDLAARPALALSLFGLSLAVTAFIATAADILASRRPVWPWLRSLPLSSAARVRDDAQLLALLASPLAAGFALLQRPAQEAVYLLGAVAWLAIRAAGTMREAGDRPFGTLGTVAVEGTILSLVVALVPPASFLLLAATPAAFLLARNAERRLKPTLWVERRHSNAGDPLSWSAS